VAIRASGYNVLNDLGNVVKVRNGPIVREIIRGERWLFDQRAYDGMLVDGRERIL